MTYSIISILALVLNIIINRDALKHIELRHAGQSDEQLAAIRYRFFLIAANCYFVADIVWGLLYDNHENDTLYPFLYLSCILYFLFMFLTLLAWIRYIVAYIRKKGHIGKSQLYAGWFLFTLALMLLVINCFRPIIFTFDSNHEYVPESGRHFIFIFQIVLYLITSIYMFYIGNKSASEEKVRHTAVGLTCLVMELFLILQILDPNHPFYAMGLMIGICLIHSFVESDEKKEKEIYDNIARGLAEDYAAMYYIDIETGEYQEFAISDDYASLRVPTEGKDFYAETEANIERYVHADDRELAHKLHQKETMLENMKGRKSYSYKYRVMIDNEPRIFLFTLKISSDGRYFVLYEKDITADIIAEAKRQESQKKTVTFTQIAESLAANYDVLYYIDAETSSFISFECRNIYGQLDVNKSGDDFFTDALNDIPQIVHKGDVDLVLGYLNRDHMISALSNHKSDSIEYRVVANDVTHYVRLTVRKTSDDSHFIIGIENIDDEIRREKQHLKALNTEKELARRDELTGVKNKTAYTELEKSVQESIDNGLDYLPFALVVCDANNLKKINDSEGHMAGDEYIRKTSMLLCEIFDHSPVFRVGGDEFVVFLRGSDYANREELMKCLRDQVDKNLQAGSRPIVASGMSEYIPESDNHVLQVFDRADKEMYENKQNLKQEEDNLRNK